MSLLRRALAAPLLAAAGLALLAVPASADRGAAQPGAVYVLGNQPGGNTVLRFDRQADGSLVADGSFPTGGTGTGASLGSQGAIAVDEAHHYLYAVNAGSNTISSFRIRPDGLRLVDTADAGGTMPISVTVHDSLVYVLDAGGNGNIAGFATIAGHLSPIRNSVRPLSSPAAGPAEVSFTPDGRRLVVAEKATQRFDVYTVDGRGRASNPTVVVSAGVTPFGFAIDDDLHAIVSEAFGGAPDGSAVSSYDLRRGGFRVVSPSVPTTETAACWIAISTDGRYAYAGNAGTNSITGYSIGRRGELTILDADGKTAEAPAGVTDLATSSDGTSLYARLGNGTVGAWTINDDGSLTSVGTFPGLPATGTAGIAAT